ncbi:MAG: hypothetical protein EA382_04645 [Spirochaetaceae bacterium]|nr:MAG: hypothetical protein EA382_04645 [Spirochaetaceae bacterium]
MKRSEFVFTIGFQGDAAVVDRRAQRQYGSLSTMELAEQGLYRAAFCSALFSGLPDEMEQFIRFFGEKTGIDGLNEDRIKRLFGIYTVPDEVKKIIAV